MKTWYDDHNRVFFAPAPMRMPKAKAQWVLREVLRVSILLGICLGVAAWYYWAG